VKVLMIAPPLLKRQNDETSIITVPPIGYGGIETVIHSLICGLIAIDCELTLIGVPGSHSNFGLKVIRDVRDAEGIRNWIINHRHEFDIIHDHSCGLIFNKSCNLDSRIPYIATHHKTGSPDYPRNTIFLSDAQWRQSGANDSPIIRIPVILDDYLYSEEKEDYYLYLGRVSGWKGVKEAAQFCQKLSAPLCVAGPSWEKEYFDDIVRHFAGTICYVGEVTGLKKIDLLSKAKGLFVLSRPVPGPWGEIWCEPGSTVVSEAAASGTPVISSTNGCLKEIVVPEIGMQLNEDEIRELDIGKIKSQLSNPSDAFNYASKNWNHITIAGQYLSLYKKIIAGSCL
jgi:glycosyltransferase involved in cell wall biosynthesis